MLALLLNPFFIGCLAQIAHEKKSVIVLLIAFLLLFLRYYILGLIL
jgi:hypothetical protein